MDDILHLSFQQEAGCTAVVVADVLVTFDAARIEDNGLRLAVATAAQYVAEHVSNFRTEAIKRARRIKESVTDILDEWLSTPPAERGTMSVELLSGSSDSTVGPYALRLSVPANNPEYEAGFIQLSLPSSVAFSNPELLWKIASDLALRVPTVWGRAGFAVEYDMFSPNSVRDREIVKWCTRFACIDIRHLILLAEKVLKCIPSVNWINILPASRMSPSGRAALGGRLKEVQLGPELVAIGVDERPILGDRNRNEDIGGYREAYTFLQGLLCEPPPIRRVMKGEQLLHWSRRFEGSR